MDQSVLKSQGSSRRDRERRRGIERKAVGGKVVEWL